MPATKPDLSLELKRKARKLRTLLYLNSDVPLMQACRAFAFELQHLVNEMPEACRSLLIRGVLEGLWMLEGKGMLGGRVANKECLKSCIGLWMLEGRGRLEGWAADG
eukprot:1156396-Pelagomonas_calceolata.AAC.10